MEGKEAFFLKFFIFYGEKEILSLRLAVNNK